MCSARSPRARTGICPCKCGGPPATTRSAHAGRSAWRSINPRPGFWPAGSPRRRWTTRGCTGCTMDPEPPRQIIAAVEERRGEIVAFLQRLVQFDSVTGNETDIQAFIAEHLNGLALRVDRFDTDPD